MPTELLPLAYLGFACLAADSHRHRGHRRAPGAARRWGWLWITLALADAVARRGWAEGVIAWAIALSLAALACTLLLSARPRWALAPARLFTRRAG
ncbi:DUF3325 family protein [Sphingomonas morindae]|uniref:DUF3325 family protein n=1 Tax=Sphingomonas morindae TaxID=1541170 RepID=A0ABY4X5A6_9SPHN|nr:DUF3325 family protein [Sphingomonas morindae]USI72064.1 DUF3325 family protein [Sphingomonas morindae]